MRFDEVEEGQKLMCSHDGVQQMVTVVRKTGVKVGPAQSHRANESLAPAAEENRAFEVKAIDTGKTLLVRAHELEAPPEN